MFHLVLSTQTYCHFNCNVHLIIVVLSSSTSIIMCQYSFVFTSCTIQPTAKIILVCLSTLIYKYHISFCFIILKYIYIVLFYLLQLMNVILPYYTITKGMFDSFFNPMMQFVLYSPRLIYAVGMPYVYLYV